ncbi:acylphosphatase [Clostridium akagii]|uniref:acylphosphatase n=1 Tax=Clostridium akagii TaxID=91623 RepID=UPI00047C13BE|nr:acylphosphatase [Clostridium akagii]
MNRYFIQVYGRVQGVGFRYFVQYAATAFKITGWVKNCDDGSVQIEAQGTEEATDNFLIKIKKGNQFIRVDDINYREIQLVGKENSFRVKY